MEGHAEVLYRRWQQRQEIDGNSTVPHSIWAKKSTE